MGKCPTCGAPAKHQAPDGDFRHDADQSEVRVAYERRRLTMAGNKSIDRLLERIDELESALRPFSEAVIKVDGKDFIDALSPSNDSYFTARAALRKSQGERT